MFKEKYLYLYSFIVISTLALFLQLAKVEPFESFSLRFNDINFDLQKKEPSKKIVFVAIDEPSVNRFGRWPWDRSIIAEGIDKLFASEIVLFDMIFSEATTADADRALAQSLSSLNASICGFFLRQKSTQVIEPALLDVLDDSSLDLLQSQIAHNNNPKFISAPYAELNILPIVESCTLSGSFSTLAQSDKLFRSYPIAFYYQNRLFASLAIQALRLELNQDIQRVDAQDVKLSNRVIKMDERGFVRLNFYKKEQYNIVSFLDLYEGKIKPQYFQDKIVIFGITEVGSGDVVSTPIGALYGPLVHYTFLSNFLENHLIVEEPYYTSLLIFLMILLPFIMRFLIKKVLQRNLVNIILYLITMLIVRYLFISNMLYIDLFYPLLALLLSIISIEAIAFSTQEKKTKFLKDAFSAYLSADLLEQLIKNPNTLTLGGEIKELSVLFSDIRGFTTLSESLDDAHLLVQLLNRYFTPMTYSVLAHEGMLDKYIGDAIMAFYNAPVDVKDHADKACLTALDMLEKLHTLNQELAKENKPCINISIGINTDRVIVGNMGSDTRFNYTVMGDGVNLSSRVEGLTKIYSVEILITKFTLAKLTQNFLYWKIENVRVKGKYEAVLLYELMADTTQNQDIKRAYDKALEFYIAKDLLHAKEEFEHLVKRYNDGVSAYFLQRIEKNLFWEIHIMDSK